MEPDQLKSILADHRRWVNHEPEGNRAILAGVILSGANLRGANLREADLIGANLEGADLIGANLRGANLREANLREANLTGADLEGADLIGADLSGANLIEADLSGANLEGADLRGANLIGANLSGANLSEANLHGANLRGVGLIGANLEGAKLSAFQIPQEGSLVGWKKGVDESGQKLLIKLLIPAEARRTACLINRKCRAEFVQTLGLYTLEGVQCSGPAAGLYDSKTLYVEGEITHPNSYDEDIRLDCSRGIHFFLTKEEALEFSLSGI